jgi:Protein of unknown function (DUF4239)
MSRFTAQKGRWIILIVEAICFRNAMIFTDGFIVVPESFRRVDTFPTTFLLNANRMNGEAFSRDSSDARSPIENASDTSTRNQFPNARRRRRPDYPSFAFNYKNDSTKSRLMKFRNVCGKEVVFPTTTKNTDDDKPSSWILQGDVFRGTPFETVFSSIYQSAIKTRIRTDRSYARRRPFEKENIDVPPNLEDLATPVCGPSESFWISTPARILSFGLAYVSFPYITHLVETFVTMPPAQLDNLTSKFGPGISILYGTFISLTLSILYNRLRTIQEYVGVESSYLVVLTRNLISLFGDNRVRAIEAAQCSADQIRTLVRSSRGAELMLLMYSDPYARIRELIDEHEMEAFSKVGYDGRSNSLIAASRDVLKDLYRVRSNRLSEEAVALPPTHFLILLSLTLLILLGYIVSIIPTLDSSGNPPFESCLLFAILSTIYILFYNFASDLNNPFDGVYQVRRSCVASHLLQMKWLIANHPLLRGEVDFEEAKEDADGVQIYSPGLGDLWFEREGLFVNGDGEQAETQAETISSPNGK